MKKIYITLVFILALQIFIPQKLASAASLRLNETGYNYTGTSFTNGKRYDNAIIWNMKMDGKDVFCIDSGAPANTEPGYVPEEYYANQQEYLSEIAYYGYQNGNKTMQDYATTQLLIWETLGEQLEWTSIPNYWYNKQLILDQVKKHNTAPSWNDKTFELIVGQDLVIEDTECVSDLLNVVDNQANVSVEKENNKLILRTDKDSESGDIKFAKVTDNTIVPSIIYKKADRQSLVDFHLQDNGNAKLAVNVKQLGNLSVKKVDSETGVSLPGAVIQFKYNGTTKEVTTDENGIALLSGIPEGTKITFNEVLAPDGYVKTNVEQVTTIKPNETIELLLTNPKQVGTVRLQKIGEQFGTEMPNENYSLEKAVYGIYDANDIRVGELVTDKTGYADFANLQLGSYYAVEEQAPRGYLVNQEKIPFTLDYGGQEVAIMHAEVNVVDKEQLGTAILYKHDAETGSEAQGAAQLDGAVYELYRQSNNELVDTVTIKDGKAEVPNLILDDYYWLEKVAPNGYQLDTEKHCFSLTYAGQENETTISETVVTDQVIRESLRIEKVDSLTGRLIIDSPAKFKIKDLKTDKFIENTTTHA